MGLAGILCLKNSLLLPVAQSVGNDSGGRVNSFHHLLLSVARRAMFRDVYIEGIYCC